MLVFLCVCMFVCLHVSELRVPRQREFVCWYSCVFVCLCVCMFQSEGFLDRESESDADRVRGEGAKAMLVACLRRLHRSGDCNSSRG